MKKLFIKSITAAFTIISVLFTFVPEDFFASHTWITQEMLCQIKLLTNVEANTVNVIISRIICLIVIGIVVTLINVVCWYLKCRVVLKGRNYLIQVEYGDLLKIKNCKRVIHFDECFTTKVGNGIPDIKASSLCGKYLNKHPELNVNKLIEEYNIVPALSKSRFQQQLRYESGTIVPNGDDLLMAFAKLDERGKGCFKSLKEYLDCLELLWEELECYYAGMDVCIPILGAGITVFGDGAGTTITRQDLLDIIILSYKLSTHKLKAPNKLRIICKRSKGFSINKVFE